MEQAMMAGLVTHRGSASLKWQTFPETPCWGAGATLWQPSEADYGSNAPQKIPAQLIKQKVYFHLPQNSAKSMVRSRS